MGEPDLAEPAALVTPDDKEPRVPYWKYWHRRRVLLALFMFTGFFNVYSLRLDMNSQVKNLGVFHWASYWDKMEQYYSDTYYISYYSGFLLTQLPGGLLAARYGGAIVILIGLGGTATITLMGPELPKLFGYYESFALGFIIFFQGLFEGVIFPSSYALWQHWAPQLERTRLVTLALSGGLCGVFFTKLVAQPLNLSLGSAFLSYFLGISGIVWCVLWRYSVRKDPELDPRISPKELSYIQESVGLKVSHPWTFYLKSRPLWAVICVHFVCNWAQHVCMMHTPMLVFMKDLWHFGPNTMACILSFPYLIMAITMQASGHLADWLIINRKLSIDEVRKSFVCVPLLVHVFLILTLTLTMTKAAVILCLTLAMGMLGIAWAGFGVQFLELAPQHAGVLFAISNTIATVPHIILSTYTSLQNENVFVTVLYISNGFILCAAVIYAVIGSDTDPSSVPSRPLFEEGPSNIPVKLIVVKHTGNGSGVADNLYVTQRPVPLIDERPSTSRQTYW